LFMQSTENRGAEAKSRKRAVAAACAFCQGADEAVAAAKSGPKACWRFALNPRQ
jgi:hypothetical protein